MGKARHVELICAKAVFQRAALNYRRPNNFSISASFNST